MASKRGASGLCFVVGVDKPVGMSSHDVVNRCRRIFGERRVGHTGTLDPLASGVMVVCVGPSTRLDAHLTLDDKRYVARIVFGASTETDDAEGQITRTGTPDERILTPAYAREVLASFVGEQKQLPPAYSAIKVAGTKAYEAARKGTVIQLQPRDICVYEAKLLGIGSTAEGASDGDPLSAGGYADEVVRPYWDVEFHVSKGTYIRSLARDIGVACGVPSYLGGLRRTSCGCLQVDSCLTLDKLEEQGLGCEVIDPLQLLGCRFFFASPEQVKKVQNGAALREGEVSLFEMHRQDNLHPYIFPCSSNIQESHAPLSDGEMVAALVDNRLAVLYAFDSRTKRLQSRCGFSIGVQRGTNI